MNHRTRQWTLISLLAVMCLLVSAMGAQAQDETAAAGNGGTGDAWANGGAAALGDVNSGGNLGNALGLGDTGGGEISGGSVANSTSGAVGVDGGTGISDASGGEDNIAFTLDPVPPPAPDPVPPAPVPPAPVPPAPDPVIPQVCVTSIFGTSCTTVVSCFDAGPLLGLNCNVPDCSTALNVPGPIPCIGTQCVPGPNAITNCSLLL